MGLTSLQVCMDSPDHWLQGTIHEETGMDSSSPSGGDMITCSRPLIERRLRPPHDLSLKCPRCDSTHTKFCYYNNYSLSQPRYFCKTCRRYWTKGGTLRNIPVGGGCRKNKKVSSSSSSANSKKSNDIQNIQPLTTQNNPGSSLVTSHGHNPTDLQLSFPETMQFSQFSNLFGNHGGLGNGIPNFMEGKYNAMFENPRAIDFMESSAAKYEGHFLGNGGGHDQLGMMGGLSDQHMGSSTHGLGLAPNFHAIPFGNMSLDGQSGNFMDASYQKALLPYNEGNVDMDQHNAIEVKPNTKLLSLEWQDQGCSDAGKDTFGYISGLGSWTGMMNGYGPSTTNSLV